MDLYTRLFEEGAPSNKTIGRAYIQIPFCRSVCSFCWYAGRYDKLYRLNDRDCLPLQSAYVKALQREIAMRSQMGQEKPNVALKVIHFGGGTPSTLDARHLIELLNSVKSAYCEGGSTPEIITVETTPYELDRNKFQALKTAGFNRISIGVQSFNEKNLSHFNRSGSLSGFGDKFGELRDLGFDNINFDMLYGHPVQALEHIETDITKLLAYSPDHVDTYLWKPPQRGLPDEKIKQNLDQLCPQKRFDAFRIIRGILMDKGYMHYCGQLFCKLGKENIGHLMTINYALPFISFGAGAFQYKYETTTKDIEEYIHMDFNPDFYTVPEETDGKKAGAFIQLIRAQLLLSQGLSLPWFNQRTDTDLLDLINKSTSATFINREFNGVKIKCRTEFIQITEKYNFLKRLNRWLSDGDIEKQDSYLKITEKGWNSKELFTVLF
ncbi:MAG TPA: hypothetical protein DHV36_15455 [Desulfobacteraceae bacterium]|nr:hypothetical protein [Desulfobacteraceae bacterium]